MVFYEEIVAWLCSCVIDDGGKSSLWVEGRELYISQTDHFINDRISRNIAIGTTKLSITAACHDVTGDVNVMGRAIKLH